MINRIIYIFLFFISIAYSSYPNEYAIDSVEPTFQYRNRQLIDDLSSQSIVDLRLLNDESIVVGTSGGLGLIENDMSLYSFNDSNLPYGGNPALEIYKDEGLIIVSGVETVNFLSNVHYTYLNILLQLQNKLNC